MVEFFKKLDHPLLFLLFLLLALKGLEAFLTWGFKELGWSGPAALMQNP
jgi:hypothetical protein